MLPPESREPFFVLDQGLNPLIAEALAGLELPIKSVSEEFSVPPTQTVDDEDIINHIADYYGFRGVWITKDNSAKRARAALAQRRRVSVVWIQQQTLSTPQQHHIVTQVIFRCSHELLDSNGPIHYLVTFHGATGKEAIGFKLEWKGRRAQHNYE